MSYAEVVAVVGGDGNVLADGDDPETGEHITVIEWPGEDSKVLMFISSL